MTTLFVSDLHLAAERPLITRTFLHFLEHRARGAGAVYILGDLFEYWAGDDDCDEPFNARILGALKALTATGVPVFFMNGNRDFLAGAGFAARSGTTLIEDPLRVDLEGTSTLLMHGDTLCTDDHEYMMFRSQLRSPGWAADFLARPLAERKVIIGGLRRQSEQEKQHKSAAIMDVNAAAVESAFRESGCARIIHGHTHRPARHDHVVDGTMRERWVLSDWYDSGSLLVCDGAGCRPEQIQTRPA